jgi:hypothetical protein
MRKEIQLSDMCASSCCLPFSFEPMVFPDDFISHHQDDKTHIWFKRLKQLKVYCDGVGIMHGGLSDNLGISSLLIYDKI